MGSTDEFFLATNPDLSGSPPKRAPPPVPVFTPSPIMPSLSKSVSLISTHEEESLESTHVEESLNSTQVQELSVDDIEDFEDDDDLEEVESRRTSRRVPNDASDLAPGLSSFATGIMLINHICVQQTSDVLLSFCGLFNQMAGVSLFLFPLVGCIYLSLMVAFKM